MITFPKIRKLSDVAVHVHRTYAAPPRLDFIGTVKLHGSNGGVVRTAEGLLVQGRNRVLTLTSDNAGFYAFVHSQPDGAWDTIFDRVFGRSPQAGEQQILFGEWCGGSIQKNVALNHLSKMFVIFAAKVYIDEEHQRWVNQPSVIDTSVLADIHSIRRAPTFLTTIDFNDVDASRLYLNEVTQQVEDVCPFTKTFGFSGTGEGIVWTCVQNPSSRLWFKTKGDRHSHKSRVPKPLISAAVKERVDTFVTNTLTEERLQQALAYLIEMEHPVDVTSTGIFLKWVGNDVATEEESRLLGYGLDWKAVARALANQARQWFMTKVPR